MEEVPLDSHGNILEFNSVKFDSIGRALFQVMDIILGDVVERRFEKVPLPRPFSLSHSENECTDESRARPGHLEVLC